MIRRNWKVLVAVVLICIQLGYLAYLHHQYDHVRGVAAQYSALGHDVLNLRDKVLAFHRGLDTPAYVLSTELVELEKQVERLHELIGWRPQHTWLGLPTMEVEAFTQVFDQDVSNVLVILEDMIRYHTAMDYSQTAISRITLLEIGQENNQHRTDINSLVDIMTQKLSSRLQSDNKVLSGFLLEYNNLNYDLKVLTQQMLGDKTHFVEDNEHQWNHTLEEINFFSDMVTIAVLVELCALLLIVMYIKLKDTRVTNQALSELVAKTEQANQAKSMFLATMSHELRTPMNGVLGVAQLLEAEVKEESHKHKVGIILESGNHLIEILNDILDFSKVEQGKLSLEDKLFTITDLTDPIMSTYMTIAMEKELALTFDNRIDPNLYMSADVSRIRQIIFNLVGNAIKFTHQGFVELSVELDTAQITPRLIIQVKDSGVGVPEDRKRAIFHPFEQADLSTTRNFGGTGLGLAIVRKLSQAMNGDVSLKSVEGVGSEFTCVVDVKVLSEQEAKEANASRCDEVGVGSLSVLIVEDNRVNAYVAVKFCENLGHVASVSESGMDALEKLKNNTFDLILMDNHMPGMNGIETTRVIRQTLKINTLIFACTADAFQQPHDDFMRAGANYILTKPLKQEKFQEAISLFSDDLRASNQSASVEMAKTGSDS
ncbi:ATP-binding protein [Vibrio sp. SCSIO 43136]|uniref:ATP-binding protein n=1 Tax=Vibrio sp. SCSIO 43136 TaxID=2819101 RepID=UPI002075D4FB|nr:ATP-binding protein [Vibrio sp. SCSIO 43136]USD66170.1 response regulator [Vibrio sp. SCSIO 43136]